MTRLLLLVLLAAFVFACENRLTPAGKKSKRDRTEETDTKGDDDEEAEEESGDDDDDNVEPKSTPPVTTADAAAPPPVQKDPFDGAPAYLGSPPAAESSEHHFESSNAGKECMACHAAGKGAPTFALGGTIQLSKTNSTGAAGVEVRVIDDKGTEIAHVTTDSSGNFWFKGNVQIPGGSRVAIRTSAGGQKMSGAIATGACNSANCHTRSLPIFLAP